MCYRSGELLHGPWERFPGPLTTSRYVWEWHGEKLSCVPMSLCSTGVCWGHPAGLQHPLPSASCSGAVLASHSHARSTATQSPEVCALLLHWCLCWQRNLGRFFDARVHACTLDATPDPPWLTPFLFWCVRKPPLCS